MMDLRIIQTIAMKELRDSLRNRWFIMFSLAFAALAFALSSLSQTTSNQLAMASYSKTAASLINLVLLFVPLIGLSLGTAGLATERETGALAYLLAQPVTSTEVLLGKYLGMGLALLASLSFGFGLAGIAISIQAQTVNVFAYVLTLLLACLLALAMLSLGFLLAVLVKKSTMALTSALFTWLFLVFIGDLGIMGAAIMSQMPITTVFFIASLNPLQMYKMAAILLIQANLEVLGPAGIYASEQFGLALIPLLILGLLLWILVPLLLALFFFKQTSFVPVMKGAKS